MLLFIIAIIILITMFGIYIRQSVPHKQLWFGVTLPEKALQDDRLKQLQKKYTILQFVYILLALCSLLPLFWIDSISMLALLYFFIWCAVLYLTAPLPYEHVHYQVIAIKRAEKWFGSSKRLRSIKADIQRLSQKQPVPIYLYLLPLVISVPLLFLAANSEFPLARYSGIAACTMIAIIFIIQFFFTSKKQHLYSRNQQVNIALNQTSKQYWSILWLTLAGFEVINAYVAYFILSQGISLTDTVSISGMIVISLIPLIAIYTTYRKIRTLELRYAHTDGKSDLVDDDEYWQASLVYNNPDNKKLFVAKRLGSGATINVGIKKGRWLYAATQCITLLLVVVFLFGFALHEMQQPTLIIDHNDTIEINDTQYGYKFSIHDIEEIKLEDKMPTGFRSNGIATNEYARGNFKLHELGQAKMYIFKQSSPYIVIKLPELYIVYNEKEPDKTKELFQQLITQID
ncbi:PH domain-containing protein [Paenibacillus yanchengensis]|uniref:PH domain-containing protein n=1 Tax=Paenibacillus yanchengensis TaxID=2035833 RepID=A0ABW4YGK1_9BACL